MEEEADAMQSNAESNLLNSSDKSQSPPSSPFEGYKCDSILRLVPPQQGTSTSGTPRNSSPQQSPSSSDPSFIEGYTLNSILRITPNTKSGRQTEEQNIQSTEDMKCLSSPDELNHAVDAIDDSDNDDHDHDTEDMELDDGDDDGNENDEDGDLDDESELENDPGSNFVADRAAIQDEDEEDEDDKDDEKHGIDVGGEENLDEEEEEEEEDLGMYEDEEEEDEDDSENESEVIVREIPHGDVDESIEEVEEGNTESNVQRKKKYSENSHDDDGSSNSDSEDNDVADEQHASEDEDDGDESAVDEMQNLSAIKSDKKRPRIVDEVTDDDDNLDDTENGDHGEKPINVDDDEDEDMVENENGDGKAFGYVDSDADESDLDTIGNRNAPRKESNTYDEDLGEDPEEDESADEDENEDNDDLQGNIHPGGGLDDIDGEDDHTEYIEDDGESDDEINVGNRNLNDVQRFDYNDELDDSPVNEEDENDEELGDDLDSRENKCTRKQSRRRSVVSRVLDESDGEPDHEADDEASNDEEDDANVIVDMHEREDEESNSDEASLSNMQDDIISKGLDNEEDDEDDVFDSDSRGRSNYVDKESSVSRGKIHDSAHEEDAFHSSRNGSPSESDADDDGLDTLEQNLSQRRKTFEGESQFSESDRVRDVEDELVAEEHDDEDEQGDDNEHDSENEHDDEGDSESDEEERLLRQYRKRDKHDDIRYIGSPRCRKWDDEDVGSNSDELLYRDDDDDDDGFQRLETVDDEAIEVPNYQSGDERGEVDDEFGMIGEDLCGDDDLHDDSDGTVGAGESAEEESEEDEEEEPDEDLLDFIVDDEEEVATDDEITDNPALDEAEERLEGQGEELTDEELDRYGPIKRKGVSNGHLLGGDSSPKRRLPRRVVDDDEDDESENSADDGEHKKSNNSIANGRSNGQMKNIAYVQSDVEEGEVEGATASHGAEEVNNDKERPGKENQLKRSYLLHLKKEASLAADSWSEEVDSGSDTEQANDRHPGILESSSNGQRDGELDSIRTDVGGRKANDGQLSEKASKKAVRVPKRKGGEDYSFSSILRVRPLPQGFVEQQKKKARIGGKEDQLLSSSSPKRPRSPSSSPSLDDYSLDDEDVEDFGIISSDVDIECDDVDDVAMDADKNEGDDDHEDDDHVEDSDEEKRDGDTVELVKGQEQGKNPISSLLANFNVPKITPTPKCRKSAFLDQVKPKPAVRRRPTSDEFDHMKRLAALVLNQGSEGVFDSAALCVPKTNGVSLYGSAWISVLYGTVRVCGATLTPKSAPMLFQSPVNLPLLVYDCVKEDEGDRVDNLNDPEIQKEDGVVDKIEDDHRRQHHRLPYLKTNGNNRSDDDDSDDEDLYSVIPQVDSIGHIDASPHLISRRENHAALCKAVYAHVKVSRMKGEGKYPDPVIFISEVQPFTSSPPLCSDLPHSNTPTREHRVANDYNGYIEPINFLRVYDGELGFNFKVPRIIKHMGGCSRRTLIIGAPNSGKSTLSRAVVNYHVTNTSQRRNGNSSTMNINSKDGTLGTKFKTKKDKPNANGHHQNHGRDEQQFFIQRKQDDIDDTETDDMMMSMFHNDDNEDDDDDIDNFDHLLQAQQISSSSPTSAPLIYVDVDVGVPDRSMPGVVSAHLVTLPSTSRRTACRSIPFCARFFGEVTPRENPEYYNECVRDVVIVARMRADALNLPMLVNCHGWMTDTGSRLVSKLCHLVEPTLILRMRGGTSVGTAKSSERAMDRLLFELPGRDDERRWHGMAKCWRSVLANPSRNADASPQPEITYGNGHNVKTLSEYDDLVIGNNRFVSYCECTMTTPIWKTFVVNGRPAYIPFDRSAPLPKEERDLVICAYFAQSLFKGTVRKVRVKDISIVFVGSDRSTSAVTLAEQDECNNNGDDGNGNRNDGASKRPSPQKNAKKDGGDGEANADAEADDNNDVNSSALEQLERKPPGHDAASALTQQLDPAVFRVQLSSTFSNRISTGTDTSTGTDSGNPTNNSKSRPKKPDNLNQKRKQASVTLQGFQFNNTSTNIPPQALVSCTVALAHRTDSDSSLGGCMDNKGKLNVVGMGLVRGVNDAGTALFICTPLPMDVLQKCNVVMVGLGVHTAGALFKHGCKKYVKQVHVSHNTSPKEISVPFLIKGGIESGGRLRVRKSRRGEDGRRYR